MRFPTVVADALVDGDARVVIDPCVARDAHFVADALVFGNTLVVGDAREGFVVVPSRRS